MPALDYASPSRPRQTPLIRALLLMAFLAAGLSMWLHFGAIEWAIGFQLAGVIVVAALALLPPVARIIGQALEQVRSFNPRIRRLVALAVFLGTAGLLYYLNFHREQSDLYPSVCDEFSYLIQAQLLAHGRLWSPAHPHPEFFTTFQLIADPVYSSIYFPGTALWIAPWSMLASDGGFAFIGPWLAASLAVMLVYLITAELLDDLAGILAAIITLTVPIWRGLAMVIMGQCIAAMLGLLLVWLFLRWRSAARAGRTRTALLWGVAAGFIATWALLTRPVDGMAYALPVMIGVIATRSVPGRLRALSMAAAIAGLLPLAGLQLSFNQAVSGSMLQTPFSWYNNKYLPGTTYGEEDRNPDRMKKVPHTAHFHLSYQIFTRPFVEGMGTEPFGDVAYERLRVTTVAGATHGMMLVWVPFALLLLIPRRMPAPSTGGGETVEMEQPPHTGGPELLLLGAPFPLMWLLYLPYGFFLYQYAGAAIPSIAFLTVAGAYGLALLVPKETDVDEPPPDEPQPLARQFQVALFAIGIAILIVGLLSAALGWFIVSSSVLAVAGPMAFFVAAVFLWPQASGYVRSWWRHGSFVFAVGALLVLSTSGLPGFANIDEDWYRVPELRQIDQILGDVPGPALVFVSPPGGDAPAEAEAVYNLGVVAPDEAQVIRAHDLGERNVELLDYYAQTQPDRRVYHYMRRTRTLTDLGTASELNVLPPEQLRQLFDELSLPWRRRYAPLLSKYGYDASEMPFKAPPESEWDPSADEQPPGAAGAQSPTTTRPDHD